MTIKITPNDKDNPPGKLADVELHFTEGVLEGLKLIGFTVWERRSGGGRNVTFPARQYSVNGERRTFALLRPTGDSTAQNRIRDAILNAYAEFEEKEAVAQYGSTDSGASLGDILGAALSKAKGEEDAEESDKPKRKSRAKSEAKTEEAEEAED